MDEQTNALLSELEAKISYPFRDRALLLTALTHTSYVKGEGHGETHNERMEFLGDAVLELCVSEYLYTHYPRLNEGKMTRIRANVVCEDALFETALFLDLGKYLRLSHGEINTGGRKKPSILSDAMEAVLGAVFLDGGMEAAKKLILGFEIAQIERAVAGASEKDYKTRLQEYLQMDHRGTIRYELVSQSGPDHKKLFCMRVCLNGEPIGEGQGGSKQDAGQNAAREALLHFGQEV